MTSDEKKKMEPDPSNQLDELVGQIADAAIDIAAQSLSAVEKTVRAELRVSLTADESFWDLGKPKPRIYEKPSFEGRTLGVTDIGRQEADSEGAGEAIPSRDSYIPPASEPVRRSSGGRVINTVDGYRSVSVPTGSYRRHTARRPSSGTAGTAAPSESPKPSEIVRSYFPDGVLIRKIEVRTWESEIEFYSRFALDAHHSHRAAPSLPPDLPAENVPYFSYVPQYAHMSRAQIEFYRWVRENIRQGKCPPCDLPYVQLYLYEIINLPDEIPPEEGVHLLARLWLGYRRLYPRLDGYLCEWLPDYCLIHGLPLPEELSPILSEIVPKAQFKEFYLNRLSEQKDAVIGRTIAEVSSDYDFRTSRYYAANRDAYETHLPAAIARAVAADFRNSRGICSLDRVYRMTRDSFCGAIVSSGIKRRLDIEFCSFTRRADVRKTVTALVKYSENKLRQMLGIKAKLGVDSLPADDIAEIDAYFAPFLPVKIKKSKDEEFMPPDYLKQYESADSGFDFGTAAAIERESWVNTDRLTGEEPAPAFTEYEEDITVPGELRDLPPETAEEPEPEPEPKSAAESGTGNNASYDAFLKEALRAALCGRFRAFCREHGVYDGEIADRINAIFLDAIGDVVLESLPGGFTPVDAYKEEMEEWLS